MAENKSVEQVMEEKLADAVMNQNFEVLAELREVMLAARNLIGKFNQAVEVYESAGIEMPVTKIVLRSGSNNGRKAKDLSEKLTAIFNS